jgi:hypothetical protein
MRRSILAIGLGLFLSFATIGHPVSAADMPLKAPPPPVVEEVGVCWVCILFAAAVIACVIECPGHHHNNPPISPLPATD